EGGGRPYVGFADAAEQDPQQRVGVGGRPDGGSDVGAHRLLVDDDRRSQSFENVDFGSGQVGHEPLDEGAVRLVDEPLGLGGDRVEHERALPGPRHAGENGQATFGDLDRDVLEVVLPSTLDADDVV